MPYRIVTPATSYPVLLAEAKEWCRIDSIDTSQDATLNLLIAMATAGAEDITGRAFEIRTMELSLTGFCSEIRLPCPPLVAIDSIVYTDINGVNQTVDAATYEVDTVSEPGRVRPVWGQHWPTVGYVLNPVRITYRAGYSPIGSPVDPTSKAHIPPEVRVWMNARLSTMYSNREHFIVDRGISSVELPRDFVDGVLDGLIIGTRFF